MKQFLITVFWTGGKQSNYIAASDSQTEAQAVFNVATVWHMDFAVQGKNRVTDITVKEI